MKYLQANEQLRLICLSQLTIDHEKKNKIATSDFLACAEHVFGKYLHPDFILLFECEQDQVLKITIDNEQTVICYNASYIFDVKWRKQAIKIIFATTENMHQLFQQTTHDTTTNELYTNIKCLNEQAQCLEQQLLQLTYQQ